MLLVFAAFFARNIKWSSWIHEVMNSHSSATWRRSRRSAPRFASTSPRPWQRLGIPSTLESPWNLEGTSWTSIGSSSALWQRSPPWRRLRRSTRWCSWWTSRPPNPRSRKLWSSSTTWSAPKSTPWSAQMGDLAWAVAFACSCCICY